ncbi:MAG: type II toxin-antitoxin system RelE/ParE family toxin [Rudaea sp.]
MIVSLCLEAQRELIEGALFYSQHADVQLGMSFIAEFERSLALLNEHPELGAVWRVGTRRFPLRRFPYSVIYRMAGDELRVIALAHQRRRPRYWSGRK